MAKYNAYVLVSTTTFGGGPTRVFFVRKEDDGGGFEDEKLRELRLELSSKYCHDLLPVDLEVVNTSDFQKSVTALVKKLMPKRKRT